MALPSYDCACCNIVVEESLAHLFIHCNFAQACWSKIGIAVGFDEPFVTLETLKIQLGVPFFMDINIIIAMSWCIWMQRNDLREYIRCKPTSPYKPCKLQSGPLDQHPKDMRGLGNFTINHLPLDWVITVLQIPPPTSALLPLDVDLMTQIEVCMICTEKLICT